MAMRLLSLTIVALMFATAAWAGGDASTSSEWKWLQDIGFVLVGAVIGAVAVIYHDFRRRASEEKDIANALYQEIADRAARCCSDFMVPWQSHWTAPNVQTKRMTLRRVLKFRPADPIVYPDIGIKMALLKPGIASPIIHFYFRLDAWRRDIDHMDHWLKEGDSRTLSPEESQLLAKRLGETLSPALKALEALQGEVSAHAVFDNKAMDAYRIDGDNLRTALRDMAAVVEFGP